jgi:hypothetical protein
MINEIKFACPYCNQHIACDASYRDYNIDCPACGNSMVVPHLTATDATHPAMVLVASAPSPKRSEPPPIPVMKGWTAQEWAQRSKSLGRVVQKTAAHWILSFIGTLIVAFVLRINRAGLWPILFCLILGGVLSAVLIAKDRRSTQAYSLIKGLGIALAVAIVIPVIGLGILFIGCMTLMK